MIDTSPISSRSQAASRSISATVRPAAGVHAEIDAHLDCGLALVADGERH